MASPDTRTPEPGELLAGKYEVVRGLAEGGMGVVLEARHVRLGHRVAVKVLRPEVRSLPQVAARFEREARAAAKIRGPHSVRIMDVDVLPDGSPFMVMEMLDGHDLGRELDERGPLPIEEAVGHLLEACAGMTEAHGLGIVHRDLKPSNLFLAREGEALRIKVLDFGISKVESEGDVKMTVTSSVLGTPLYMSPEQIRSAKNVDERTDIWSLGVILYELLSGRPPFDCESATGLAAAIVADDVKPVGELRPELPAGLAAVVMKALEKKPERRFQTVLELGQALAPFGPESARVALRAAPASAPRPLRLLPANAASPTAPTLERADTLVAAPGSVPTSTPATEPGWDATPSATRNRGGRAALLALAAASALALGGAAWLALGGAESPPDAARVLPAEPAASRPLASADPELAPSPPSPSSVPAVTPAPLESAQIGPRPSAAARAKPSAKAGAGAAEAAPPKAPAAPPPTATNPNRL